MQNRRGFFQTLAGIVVGGAGAAVAGPNLKLQNKPSPVKAPMVGGAYGHGDGFSHYKITYLRSPNDMIFLQNPRMNAQILGTGA